MEFVWGWLKNAEYGREPDIDGDVEHGWRVFVDDWKNTMMEREMTEFAACDVGYTLEVKP